MNKGRFLDEILRSKQTVFSRNDITLLWRQESNAAVRSRLKYYVDNQQLVRLRKGLYAKDNKYDRLELATKILTPSYVSFETVLARAGIIFQYYSYISLASYITREVECAENHYTFKKIKSEALVNPLGIEQKTTYSIASTERAVLDTLYLNKDFYFDNLSTVDWDQINTLATLYENKRLLKSVNNIYQQYKAALK